MEDKNRNTLLNKNLLYVSEDGGNPNTAMFVHTINVAKLFEQVGYEVSIVSEGNQDFADEKYCEGINLYNVKCETGKGLLGRISFLNEKLTGKKLIAQIKKVTKDSFPDVILLYGFGPRRWLHKYCIKHKITYLVEMTDWFEGRDRNHLYARLFFQPIYDRYVKNLSKTADGIIAVSEWLKNYFDDANCIQIPPIFDISDFEKYRTENCITENSNNNRYLKVAYTGTMGNKDVMEPFIEALLRINTDNIKIRFEVAGISNEEFIKKFGNLDWSQLGVVVHGQVKHEEAVNIVAKADFSVLLRHNRRYAKAGFSTKAAESMLCGVPVIATCVGGTDTVIEDGVNGILIPNNEIDTIEKKLKELLCYSSDELIRMKKNTSRFADEYFSYSSYTDLLDKFIEQAEKYERII